MTETTPQPEVTQPYDASKDPEWTRDSNAVGLTIFLLCSKNIFSHLPEFFPNANVRDLSRDGEMLFVITVFMITVIIAAAKNKKMAKQVAWMFRHRWPFWAGQFAMLINILILIWPYLVR